MTYAQLGIQFLLTWIAFEGSLHPSQVPALAAESIAASPCSQILDKDDDNPASSQGIPIALQLPILFR